MKWTAYHHFMWFWCWACFRAYLTLPMPATHKSRYGRFNLWLLGFAGGYAHSTRADFHLCIWFHPNEEAQAAAWEAHSDAVASQDGSGQ